jgi:hypothetical protein
VAKLISLGLGLITLAASVSSAAVEIPGSFMRMLTGEYLITDQTHWDNPTVSLGFTISPDGNVTINKWIDEVEVVGGTARLFAISPCENILGEGPNVAYLLFTHTTAKGAVNIHIRLTYRKRGRYSLLFLDAIRNFNNNPKGVVDVYYINGNLLKRIQKRFVNVEAFGD